jgi:hypothetical protein
MPTISKFFGIIIRMFTVTTNNTICHMYMPIIKAK